jgi:DNA ligase (NAD+)
MILITKAELDKYQKAYSEGHAIITDEEYDNLLEEYLNQVGESNRPFLRQKQSGDVNDVVGTLTKVYGVTTPMRPDQKVYTDWIRTKKIPNDAKIIVQPKFDGCSVAIDAYLGKYYTRGDVDNGESVDVTALFKDHFKNGFGEAISAVKFEAIMSHEVFEKLGLNKSYKRPRDVVAATITSQNTELSQYITLVPLREYSMNDSFIPSELEDLSLTTTADDFEGIESFISDKLSDGATVKFNGCTYSIDGVVVSVLDDGRTTEEVAIKILNNVKETKIINIDYQYGKTGKITPVGILEPVKFDNITVDHVGLSTLDRVMSLGLKYNDTVRIVYNIVPYLIDSYHDGSVPIPIPKNCPICGAPLNFRTLKTVRCTNPQCSGLKIGLIHRYCEKMKMMGIAKSTITKFYEAGLVECIGDLYRLTPEKIMSIDGFKEKSANNIIKSIHDNSRDVDLAKWLGALPIKDISAKTWQLIINAKYPSDNMKATSVYRNAIENGTPDSFMMECVPNYVYGFSTNTYAAMREGLVLYWSEIQDAIKYISFNVLTDLRKPTKGRVTLTGTRDDKLIAYLTEKGYEVNDYSSKTIALVIPEKGYVSSKVAKAAKSGIPIYTIQEAYEALV